MLPPITTEILNEFGNNSLLVTLGPGSAMLDVSDLDSLIENLAKIRSDLLPPSPKRLSRDHKYVVETNPRWQTVRNPLFDGLIVFFRHTAFGWVGFAIPRDTIQNLIDTMSFENFSPCAVEKEANN